MTTTRWDYRFLAMAEMISTWSKDPSTKCGAVIIDTQKRIISMGFNGFPAGTDDSEELYYDRERKYRRVLHAEKNALLFARQNLTGYTIYVWPMPSCSQCAAAIIQSGICRVVTIVPNREPEGRWSDDIVETRQMFSEAGVVLNQYKEIKR